MRPAPRILYIGQLWKGSTTESRRRTIEALGYQTVPFDTAPFIGYRNRLLRTVAHRANIGPPVSSLNCELLEFISRARQEIDCVWVDKGVWLYPQTVEEIAHLTQAVLVHYTPDSQFLDNASRHFRAAIPLYDILFTTKPFEVELYRGAGARRVELVHQSYDSDVLRPIVGLSDAERIAFASDVCFIGRCEPHYARCLKAAVRSRGRVRVWGPGWRRYSRSHGWAQSIFAGDGVWGDDYARAINAASIGLCLLSKRFLETTTTRTFEIPGCGTFMLAERTDFHRELFREGVEADFFSDHEEMIDKINFYLAHPEQRERIAGAGYQRCLDGGHSNHNRMRQLMEMVEQTHSRFVPATTVRRELSL